MHTFWNQLHSWARGRNSFVPVFCSMHVLRQAIVPYMIHFKDELVIPPPKGCHDKTQHNELHYHRNKPSIHVVGQECDNVSLLSCDEYD